MATPSSASSPRRAPTLACSIPRIVAVYDVGRLEDDARPYIVMQRVEGRTLARLLAESRRLPPERIMSLLRQLAGALGHAHDRGLVHRRREAGETYSWMTTTMSRLFDFGLAKGLLERGLTQIGTKLGTPTYMSPEQCRGEAAGSASDIYSLGCLAFQLFTGRPPLRRAMTFRRSSNST